jgi:hypothetical protein
MRFKVLAAVKMSIMVFWSVTLCGLTRTRVLEEHSASIFTSVFQIRVFPRADRFAANSDDGINFSMAFLVQCRGTPVCCGATLDI